MIPVEGFSCSEEQKSRGWKVKKAWLYGLRAAPRGWWGTIHDFQLSRGLVSSAANTRVDSLHGGEVLLLSYVDELLTSGSSKTQTIEVVMDIKNRFEVVDVGQASYLLGLSIYRDLQSGSLVLSHRNHAPGVSWTSNAWLAQGQRRHLQNLE